MHQLYQCLYTAKQNIDTQPNILTCTFTKDKNGTFISVIIIKPEDTWLRQTTQYMALDYQAIFSAVHKLP